MFGGHRQEGNNDPYGLLYFVHNIFKPIPLISVEVKASVVHAVAQVEISQTYQNHENVSIEATYMFPVDSNGAVTHFHAESDGQIIKGVVKTTEEALKDYNEAVANHKTAYLGEETKPDVFKLRIGYLLPGSTTKVVIGYTTEVKNDPDSHAIRFVLPTTVAPRYVPGSDGLFDHKSRDLANMTHSSHSPAPLSISVFACIQGELESVTSSSNHNIQIEPNVPIPEKPGWGRVIINLNGTLSDMNRDFILVLKPKEVIMTPRIYTETLSSTGSIAMMTHFIPSFALKEGKTELILLLDRSGSMNGDSIKLAREAVQLFIHSLPVDCYFNLIGFGTTFQPMFPYGSQYYSRSSMLQAMDYATKISANMGGTEIMQPLEFAFSQNTIPGYLRQIFVLTDGEISNTEEVIGLIKRNSHNSRVFSLGIGSSCSRHLIEGIAKAGGGTCAYAGRDENIQIATLGLLKNSLQPSLTDVKVEWVGVPLPPPPEQEPLNKELTLFGYNKPIISNNNQNKDNEVPHYSQSPKNIPPIFDGTQLVVFGIFPAEIVKPSSVKITANSPDGVLSLTIPIQQGNDIGSTGMLHTLAAIKLVRELEMEDASGFGWSGKDINIKRKIISIAVENGFTSKYTSYIAIDERENPILQHMHHRQVPSQLPQNSSNRLKHCGFGSSLCFGSSNFTPGSFSPQQMQKPMSTTTFCFGGASLPQQQMQQSMPPTTSSSFGVFGSLPRDATDGNFKGGGTLSSIFNSHLQKPICPNPATGNAVMKITSYQDFDGCFPCNMEICNDLKVDWNVVNAALINNGWNQHVLGTVLAITFFTMEHPDKNDLWDLLVGKAKKWLGNNVKDVIMLQNVEAFAKGLFYSLNIL